MTFQDTDQPISGRVIKVFIKTQDLPTATQILCLKTTKSPFCYPYSHFLSLVPLYKLSSNKLKGNVDARVFTHHLPIYQIIKHAFIIQSLSPFQLGSERQYKLCTWLSLVSKTLEEIFKVVESFSELMKSLNTQIEKYKKIPKKILKKEITL